MPVKDFPAGNPGRFLLNYNSRFQVSSILFDANVQIQAFSIAACRIGIIDIKANDPDESLMCPAFSAGRKNSMVIIVKIKCFITNKIWVFL
jgi:hypothetical protein